MISISNGGMEIPHTCFKFSGGELQVKLIEKSIAYYPALPFIFSATITSSDDLMELALCVDALKRITKVYEAHLVLPYMPYARQDRVCSPGEALSLRVAATFINSLGFDKIVVTDPHSDVTPALLNNCTVVDISEIFEKRLFNFAPLGNTVLVSPDAGANKKVLKLAQTLKVPMVRADKVRDVNTGDITGTVVHTEHLGDKPVLVVDDICDGGRTFIELAKALREKTNGPLNLYVTHGIFSKGLGDLLELYYKIYCPYVFPNVAQNERLARI